MADAACGDTIWCRSIRRPGQPLLARPSRPGRARDLAGWAKPAARSSRGGGPCTIPPGNSPSASRCRRPRKASHRGDARCRRDRRGSRFPPLRSIVARSRPPAWQTTVEAALRLAGTSASSPWYFGSLAWSALTGLDYLGPASDLDLLWPIGWAQGCPGLLDGLPDARRRRCGSTARSSIRRAGAWNWRELAPGAPEVLVKRLASVEADPRPPFCSQPGRRMNVRFAARWPCRGLTRRGPDRCASRAALQLEDSTPGRSPAWSARSTPAATTTWTPPSLRRSIEALAPFFAAIGRARAAEAPR